MKVKEFFKSNAFKSLVVLLSIVIIAGALLAIFNDLLAVSETEAENRIYSKIYGETVETDPVPFTEEQNKFADGSVEKAVKVKKDGNYLVKATGNGAFNSGTVTVWVVVEMKDGAISGVGKVVFDSTTVSKYYETSSAFFKNFDTNDDKVVAGEYFGVSSGIINPSSGATASARAINNAVNTAIDFVKSVVLGQSVGESIYEHQEWLSGDPEINRNTAEKTVTYALMMKSVGNAPDIKVNVTVSAEGITEFTTEGDLSANDVGASTMKPDGFYLDHIDASLKNGSFFQGKTLSQLEALLGEKEESSSTLLDGAGLTTGATNSSAVLIRAAVYALANYDAFLALGGEQA